MVSQRYEDKIDINVIEISKEKNIEIINDSVNSFFKMLTEVEQRILDILFYADEVVTFNKIRSIFTQALLMRICKFISDNEDKLYFVPNDSILNHRKDLIDNAKAFYKDREKFISIIYPKDLLINLKDAAEVIEKTIIGSSARIMPTLKDGEEEIKQESLEFYKTETDFMNNSRKVMSEKGLSVPSIDLIKNSLNYFKSKKIVMSRKQNNNQLWYFSPEFNIIMRRIKRLKPQDKINDDDDHLDEI